MEQLPQLIRQCGRARARLTTFKIFIAKLEDEPKKIVELNKRSNFENVYQELITKARRLSMIEQILHLMVKLPNIDLPKSMKITNVGFLFGDFELLMASNIALANVQKLHYLRSALRLRR
ncbi:hypothetical protein ACFW04_000787 [Cataglyphis niger]